MALTPQELAEQDREYQHGRPRCCAGWPPRSRTRRRRDGEAERAAERGQRRIADVINTLQFKVQGRAMHDGVPAIVVTFTPKPDAKPETRQGRIAQKFAGTVWIDEAAMEVMRVEAKAIDDISFGYGLIARLGEGTVATADAPPDRWRPLAADRSSRSRDAGGRPCSGRW